MAHEETISKMEGHSRDYADEISDLSNALDEERGLRLALEESYKDRKSTRLNSSHPK